ncbi:hypothetical protein AA958_17405 [Streptomyces sp. CNQ-509]|nr:hypothetical protein AA958_17405 [Streptomyces sp. CNQ-509]
MRANTGKKFDSALDAFRTGYPDVEVEPALLDGEVAPRLLEQGADAEPGAPRAATPPPMPFATIALVCG